MPPKKAASKHAKPKPDPLKEERRAHEHRGRVEILALSLPKDAGSEIARLRDLAHAELKGGHAKEAADLLRGAEHLSFGAALAGQPQDEVHPKLEAELRKEFDSKAEKAEEHWATQDEPLPALEEAYQSAWERAQALLEEHKFRAALEYVRGAEALAHVKLHDTKGSDSKAA